MEAQRSRDASFVMRAGIVPACVLLVAGCETLGYYTSQIQGVSPMKLVPLYFQEKQYVQDRRLVAAVQGALAADPALAGAGIEVDAYLKQVMLRGLDDPALAQKAAAAARAVPGVESVRVR